MLNRNIKVLCLMSQDCLHIYIFIILFISNVYCHAVTESESKLENSLYYDVDYRPEGEHFIKIVRRDVEASKNVTVQSIATTSTTANPNNNNNKTVSVTTAVPIPNFVTSESNNSHYDPDSKNDEDSLNVEGLNTSITQFDHHRYYRSFSKRGMKDVVQYWVDLDNMPQEKVISHDTLSSAYRRALTVTLSFDFPFYGHTLRNVTIATGGFLFTGSFLHKWLAATQYIAPLMANFDTSVSPEATVKYADNGTSLTVQWDKVVLQDNPKVGPFTFQATIHKTGDIVFAYRDIPVTVTLIKDAEHPVKVGLSDAYIVEKTIFYVRKKTIYEYHKIDMKSGLRIDNWTAIVFEPLPNCVDYKTCNACLTAVTNFQCEWCPEVSRCSDGLDRHRQDWLEGGCEHSSISNDSYCNLLPPPSQSPSRNPAFGRGASGFSSELSDKNGTNHNALVGLFIVMLIALGIGAWVAYAYLNPHTTSGQLLIKYRPRAWSWRRGEARYTAATMHSIHM